MTGWLVGWSVGWLVGWLVGRLVIPWKAGLPKELMEARNLATLRRQVAAEQRARRDAEVRERAQRALEWELREEARTREVPPRRTPYIASPLS